jgi:hypothetical protein
MAKRIVVVLLVVAVATLILVQTFSRGWFVSHDLAGDVAPEPRAAAVVARYEAAQSATAEALGAMPEKQVLFGDFHVHTTFSFDAFMMNLPMSGGTGAHPPSDACDFARYCSALDFWSINDHAEAMTPALWQETIESVRQCNEVSGDESDPDLVTYLGWEWSHIGSTPRNHYGHKNVVLLGTDDDEIPNRPIGARNPNANARALAPSTIQRLGLAAINGERGLAFNRLLSEAASTPLCDDNVPVRDLPDDCLESTATPEGLFAKLDDWGFPSIVIPHGTAWGLYTPAGSDWRKQLAGHDAKRQTLVEIYSGHGNSEQLPDWREVIVGAKGALSCPQPTDDYLPSCWRAGQLIREECRKAGEGDAECARRERDARSNYLNSYQAGWKTVPGFTPLDWLDSGQKRDGFQPAFNYRPRSSVQYMLAIRDFSNPADPKRFKFGFLGSSDIHSARPGTGYKELARGDMTDGRGRGGESPSVVGSMFGSPSTGAERAAESVPYDATGESPLRLFEIERGSAYFITGGLVAVHSEGRDRHAIWDALQRKEVYATSGRRTLLWFDMIEGNQSIPMGSTTRRTTLPRFRIRAAGSFEQKPGCPDYATSALGQERVDHICQGECYHPSDKRRPITRIEVVRIRPQIREDEPVQGLVEDPWRSFPCPADGSGCVIEFADTEFPERGRDTVYYARAIEAPDQLIEGGDPLRCSYDDAGVCVSIDPCGAAAPGDDDCLGEAEPRAWSSPIFVDYGL